MADRIVAKITVTEAEASCAQNTILTSGMAGTQLEFSFSEQWEGLSKTVVFVAGDVTSYAYLATDNTCLIPSEVLVTPRIPLVVGVYGADGTTVVIPTIYTSLGLIAVGTGIPSDAEIGVTQSLYDQVTALQVAMSGELVNIKEAEIKEVDLDASEAGKVGTVSVSLQTTWIDDSDHSQGKKATFTFKNLKGNGIRSVTFNDSNNLVITQTDGTATTFGGIANAISAMEDLEAAVNEEESKRVSAENSRKTAEESRVSAESGRVSAESARDTAESKRVSTENSRVSAESSRISAEESRVSAENSRVTNESSRVISESSRVTAENKRVSAESARVTEWNNLDSEIRQAAATATSKAKEATDARDATIQAKTDGVNAINSAKTSAISAITTQQTTSVKAVTDEGTTQVQRVKDEGASYQAELDKIKDMTSTEEQAGDYAGYHLGFYLDENGDLCQKD